MQCLDFCVQFMLSICYCSYKSLCNW